MWGRVFPSFSAGYSRTYSFAVTVLTISSLKWTLCTVKQVLSTLRLAYLFRRMTKILNFGRTFLLWYAHDHVNFRLQEFYAITKMFNINFEWIEEPSINEPFFLINVPSPCDVKKIMSRTVLIR
ncbi:hypothetical protein AVEN_147866-1 [Araneus ventricosus]|uniref:tRNA (guanine(10)-N(2))-methyltransferase TRMT11 N-terminal domain-containing protein n=1 Tax=Araneus ventricosus TaxID=182803 RepID=A0A4Y2R3X6_ARAVE|nr:hypothetical protein AVEN_147866-1 [Araneus ventricosus]